MWSVIDLLSHRAVVTSVGQTSDCCRGDVGSHPVVRDVEILHSTTAFTELHPNPRP